MPKNIDKLLGFFKLTKKNSELTPATTKISNDGQYRLSLNAVNLPNNIKSAYDYVVDSYNISGVRTNEYRIERYKDLRYMVTVDPICTKALKVYNTEVYKPSKLSKPIEIVAKDKKIEKLFYEWIDSVGINEEFIRAVFDNLIVEGDGFWINEIDETNGITSCSIIDPTTIVSRLEFNPSVCNFDKAFQKTAYNIANNKKSMKNIIDSMNKKSNNIADFFKSYCLGYEVNLGNSTIGLPPWNVTHCRMFTTEKDFFPFGKSPLFNCLPIWKSLQTTQTLIDMARCLSMPRDKITIDGDIENSNPITRMKKINDAIKYMNNLNKVDSSNANINGVGSKFYCIKDSFDIDTLESNIDIDKLGDYEIKEKKLIYATGIPSDYIDPNANNNLGGDNSKSLKYLSKMFQNTILSIKESFLKGIDETFRMHLMLINEGGLSTEFELYLPINSDDEDEDRLSELSKKVEFVNNMFDNLKDLSDKFNDNNLSTALATDIIKNYMPEFPGINDWLKAMNNSRNNETDNSERKVLIENVKHTFDECIKQNPNLINEKYMNLRKKSCVLKGNFIDRYVYNNSYEKYNGMRGVDFLEKEIQLNRYNKIED